MSSGIGSTLRAGTIAALSLNLILLEFPYSFSDGIWVVVMAVFAL